MKIAILSTYGGGGGAARAMHRLAKGLSARGHVVNIISVDARPHPAEFNHCRT